MYCQMKPRAGRRPARLASLLVVPPLGGRLWRRRELAGFRLKAELPAARFAAVALLALFLGVSLTCLPPKLTAAETHSSLVIVIDGLRPDYITQELMPNLLALGESGVVADAHHSVFPTVTRVNSPSIATGSYPGTHGLMHNTIYLPEVSSNPIDTADGDALLAAEMATGGRLLNAVSIGELLDQAGKKLLVTSSGTTGAAYLLNHKFTGGGLLNSRDFIRPFALRTRVREILGPFPPQALPNAASHHWAVEAYLEIGLKEIHPDVTLMWLNDPDGTAHKFGVGAPETKECLRLVDAEVGRLLAALTERGIRDQVNILVTADHGFSTQGGKFNLTTLLAQNGLGDGVLVVGGQQIYVKAGGDDKIRQIVHVLQSTDWVGGIFTRPSEPGSRNGFVPGTLSFEAIHYQHPRAADILVDAAWSEAVNKFGYAGATTLGGVAGHGTGSPFDIHIRLIAAGPDFKRGVKSHLPSGNIDIAPTLCRLNGITPPSSMAGRVLTELLRDGPTPESVKVTREIRRASTKLANGGYEMELHEARVGTTEYVDFVQAHR